MAHDKLFYDGFDKYGPDDYALAANRVLGGGEWTSAVGMGVISGFRPALGAGATGLSFWCYLNGSGYLSKSLGGNYARLIGGFYLRRPVGFNPPRIEFMDDATVQCSIKLENDGRVMFYRGAQATLLATAAETIPSLTDTSIEFDITFHNSTGIAKIYLNNTLTTINLSSQDLCSTANNYCNAVRVYSDNNAGVLNFDHFYLRMFLAGGSGDTILGSPYVETSPVLDEGATTDFTPGALLVGELTSPVFAGSNTSPMNQVVRRVYAPVSGEIASVVIRADNARQFAPVIYSDASGSPDVALGSGPAVITPAAQGVLSTMPLTTPVAVTAGNYYWVGYQSAVNTSVYSVTGNTAASTIIRSRAFTTLGVAPTPFGAGNSNVDVMLGAVITNISTPGVNDLIMQAAMTHGPVGDLNYVQASTSGNKDIYTFAPLANSPSTVHSVAIKALLAASASEVVDLEVHSDGTTSDGDNPNMSPGAGYMFNVTKFALDPDGNVAWTGAAVNASTGGVKIA